MQLCTTPIKLFFCALMLSMSAVVIADQALLDKASALRASGQVKQAYQLLLGQADKYAGDAAFDYQLGIAAIDAGVPLQAVFALERVLDSNPDNAAARAELAKAYFLIGENQAARAEFNKAKQAEMPDAARAMIDSYVSSIDERILGGKQRTSIYAEAGIGFDSNVNSATASSQITAPGGLVFNVNKPETDSPVARVEGGGSFSRALKDNLNWYGNGKLEFYRASDASEFSTRNAEASLGLHFLQGREQYRVALVAQNFAVDSKTSRNLFGLNGQWQHTFDARNMLSVFAQYATLKYPDASTLDADQLSSGVSWIHAMAVQYQPVIYLTGYLGTEDEKSSTATFAGRDYFGVRAGAQLRTSSRLSWNGVLAYQSSDYHGPDIFNITHKDDYINLQLAANYSFPKDWSLKPEISYTKNDSNADLSSYTRTRAMVNLRKEF